MFPFPVTTLHVHIQPLSSIRAGFPYHSPSLPSDTELLLALGSTQAAALMEAPLPPRLLFAVPRGFEDVAAQDILRFLPPLVDAHSEDLAGRTRPEDVRYSPDSGYVELQPPHDAIFRSCIDAYNSGVLWAVTRCLIGIGPPIQISAELEQQLHADKLLQPSRQNATPVEAVEDTRHRLSKRRAKRGPRPERDIMPSETKLLEHLCAAGLRETQASGSLNASLEAWQRQREHDPTGATVPDAGAELAFTFAVNFERRELHLPTLKSSDIASRIGGDLHTLLLQWTGKDEQKVNLSNPDLNVSAGPPERSLSPLAHESRNWSIHRFRWSSYATRPLIHGRRTLASSFLRLAFSRSIDRLASARAGRRSMRSEPIACASVILAYDWVHLGTMRHM